MHGEEVDRVVRVWSAGDSDMLCETILYITPWNEPRTAVIRPEPGSEELTLVCRPGWDYFNPVYV